MICYLVTFHCCGDRGGIEFHQSFYVDNTVELSEQILEYQEELEDTLDVFVVAKDIREVKC